MSKFNVGDKVRLLDIPIGTLKIGDICTVETVLKNGSFTVKGQYFDYNGKPYTMHEDYWELVENADAEVEKAIKLLEGIGYTLTEPKPVNKGLVLLYNLEGLGDIVYSVSFSGPDAEAKLSEFISDLRRKFVAVVPWTEGDGTDYLDKE